MSIVKMTDILVSTSAFVVTLSYPTKAKSSKNESATEFILEVTPIIQSATKDIGLAKQFFDIITSDSTRHNKRAKDKTLSSFVQKCSKRLLEEYWDSSHWKTLQGLSLRLPYLTCILYDTTGNLICETHTKVLDILWALQKLEEQLFISTSGVKAKRMPFRPVEPKKEKRSTHKYFLHHKARR